MSRILHPVQRVDRELPSSPEAERGVIGSILLLPSVLDDVMSVVRPEDFHSPANATLYNRLLAMHKASERIDPMLLVDQLKNNGEFTPIGGMPYLATVIESVVNATHATYYATIVSSKAQARNAIASLATAQDALYAGEKPTDVLAALEKKMATIEDSGVSSRAVTWHDATQVATDKIVASEERGTGLATTLDGYDEKIGGVFGGELIVLAARPGCGKTSMAVQVATGAARQGVSVLIISLEMSATELVMRQIAGDAEVDSRDIRACAMTNEEKRRLLEMGYEQRDLPIRVLDLPRCSTADIRREAKLAKRIHEGLGLVVVDYAGLVTPDDPKIKRNEQFGQITRDMKALARELDVPVLLLAQLSRKSEESKSGRPMLSHLKDSGDLEQDADVVWFVHRPELSRPDDPDLRGKVELIVAKNRNGPVTDIEMLFDAKRTRFVSVEKVEPVRYAVFDAYNSGTEFTGD